MTTTQVYFDPTYIREVWGIFGAGVFVLALRHFVRLRTAGFRRYQGDDYMSFLVLLFHAIDATTVTLIYYKGSNVDFIGRPLSQFSDKQIGDIVYGSKMEKLAWYSYISLLWALKGCLLFFYNRISFGLTEQVFVKVLAVAAVVTYIALFLTISLSCRPFRLNWQVLPLPPAHCMVRRQDFIVCTTLNTVTDAAILSVPVPLLWKLRVPLHKKIPIGILLCSGIFVIAAAITRVVITLGTHPSALTINRWGMRETIAGIVAVNAPILKPLLTKSFWIRGCRCSTSGSSNRNQNSDPTPRGPSDSGGTSNTKSSGISKLSAIFKKPEAVELIDMSNKTATTVTKAESEAAVPQLTTDGADFQQHANESQEIIIQRPEPVLRREDYDLERAIPHPGVRKDAELGVVDHSQHEEEHRQRRTRADTLPEHMEDEQHGPYRLLPRRQERPTGRVVRIGRSNTVS